MVFPGNILYRKPSQSQFISPQRKIWYLFILSLLMIIMIIDRQIDDTCWIKASIKCKLNVYACKLKFSVCPVFTGLSLFIWCVSSGWYSQREPTLCRLGNRAVRSFHLHRLCEPHQPTAHISYMNSIYYVVGPKWSILVIYCVVFVEGPDHWEHREEGSSL